MFSSAVTRGGLSLLVCPSVVVDFYLNGLILCWLKSDFNETWYEQCEASATKLRHHHHHFRLIMDVRRIHIQ